MKNCWKILDIEETTDVDIIRRAYLALLPSFHPETDPQGFKQLRQAYEEALRIAQSPAKSVWQPEEYEVAEHEILLAFRALLASDSERFLPSAWQRFIQQLNYCSMEEIDELRWSLCTIAMNTAHLSFECVVLLAERLRWLQEENTGEIDEEELESFLYAIAKGNVFNFQTILHLPVAVQNDTIDFYQMFARIWSSHPQWLTLYLAQHRAVIIPDDAKLHRNLLRWYSAGRLDIVLSLARQITMGNTMQANRIQDEPPLDVSKPETQKTKESIAKHITGSPHFYGTNTLYEHMIYPSNTPIRL